MYIDQLITALVPLATGKPSSLFMSSRKPSCHDFKFQSLSIFEIHIVQLGLHPIAEGIWVIMVKAIATFRV